MQFRSLNLVVITIIALIITSSLLNNSFFLGYGKENGITGTGVASLVKGSTGFQQLASANSNDLVLSNEYMTIRLNETYFSNPSSLIFSSVQSWKYNVQLDPERKDENYDWATATSAYDGSQPYVPKTITVERNLLYNNATGYRLITQRETSRFSSLWNATIVLPFNRSYFLIHVEITNTDNETIILDEIASHIHDGIIILSSLRGQLGQGSFPSSLANDKLYIHGLGEVPFVGTEGWKDYRFITSKPFVTQSDSNTGESFTVGFLDWDTAPNQVVPIYRLDSTTPIGGQFGVTTQRTEIPENKTFSYDLFVAIHNNTEITGEEIYDSVKREYKTFLRPWKPSPTVSLAISLKDSTNMYYVAKFNYQNDNRLQLVWLQKDALISGINDTDNDGALEIYAFRIKLIQDKYYYNLIRFDERTGRLVWNKTLVLSTGDYYRYFQFEDLNGDGIKEILIGKQYNDETQPTPLQLLILNSTNGEILLWYDGGTPKLWTYPVMYDYDNDGIRDVIFYGWHDGLHTDFKIISFRNFQPTVLSSFSYPSWGLSISYVEDFNLDGIAEWLIGGWGSQQWRLLDNNGNQIWNITIEGNAEGDFLVTKKLIDAGIIAIGSRSYDLTYQYVHIVNTTTGEDLFPPVQIYGGAYFPTQGVFDLNQDNSLEVAVIGDDYENGRKLYLIDTAKKGVVTVFDNVISPPPASIGENYGSNAFVDFDFDGEKDLLLVFSNGTIARGFINGSLETLGSLNSLVPDIVITEPVSPIFYIGNDYPAEPEVYYPLPSSPLKLKATQINTSIILSWEAPINKGSSSIARYNIYRSVNTPSHYIKIASTSDPYLIDNMISRKTVYYYTVTAENDNGEGPYSNPVRIYYDPPTNPPSSPKNLQAVITSYEVTLSWTLPKDDGGAPILFFRVYRTSSQNASPLIIGKSNFNHYVDTDIEEGKTYYYSVTAVNSAGESNASKQIEVKINLFKDQTKAYAFRLGPPSEGLLIAIVSVPF